MSVFTKSGEVLSKAKAVILVALVFSVSITAFLPMSWLAYGAETSYVYGYVVDEDGAVLSGVTVQLISSGMIKDKALTNSKGYFSMSEVEYGTYSLSLTKDGYADVLKTVTLQTVRALGIMEVLVKQPEVAFFDEPTLGLDPKATKELRDILIKLNKEQGRARI